jgi:hypothetical protein
MERTGKLVGLLVCAALMLCLTSPTMATPLFKITEVYVGIDGEDGTEDWIEVTNRGDTAGDTADLIYDDESLSVVDGGALPSFILDPGGSAIILVAVSSGDEATAISDFVAVWGSGLTVGATGGGGFSQSGDTAGLLLGDGTIVDTVVYYSSVVSNSATIDVTLGTQAISQIGHNGAYESNEFFNDNLNQSPDYMWTLVGGPGAAPVPEPMTVLLVAAASGLLARLRRRGN